jgi:hypothetical protein
VSLQEEVQQSEIGRLLRRALSDFAVTDPTAP